MVPASAATSPCTWRRAPGSIWVMTARILAPPRAAARRRASAVLGGRLVRQPGQRRTHGPLALTAGDLERDLRARRRAAHPTRQLVRALDGRVLERGDHVPFPDARPGGRRARDDLDHEGSALRRQA